MLSWSESIACSFSFTKTLSGILSFVFHVNLILKLQSKVPKGIWIEIQDPWWRLCQTILSIRRYQCIKSLHPCPLAHLTNPDYPTFCFSAYLWLPLFSHLSHLISSSLAQFSFVMLSLSFFFCSITAINFIVTANPQSNQCVPSIKNTRLKITQSLSLSLRFDQFVSHSFSHSS